MDPFGQSRIERLATPLTQTRAIAATAANSHREVNLLLPGRVIRDKRSVLFGDRFELPSDTKVGLEDLLGFKLQLAPRT